MTLYFTLSELNPHSYKLDATTEANLNDLIVKLSILREKYGKALTVTSGLRSQADQARINPKAPKSKHLTGNAADLSDPNKELQTWIKDNVSILEEIGLWYEDFGSTPNWVHCQNLAPKSGKRFFIP